MIVRALKMALCVAGVVINLAKVPGEYSPAYKLPDGLAAVADFLDAGQYGGQYLSLTLLAEKKNEETYLTGQKKWSICFRDLG